MYNFYDDEGQGLIKDIEYTRSLYDMQSNKVKQEEYIKNLLFNDYVNKIKCHKSRYDYIENIFLEAQCQVSKKKKKEREQLSIIEQFVREDFLNDCTHFELTNIVSCGYADYCWHVEFNGLGQNFYISIPMTNNINTNNIRYAHNGMFAFVVKESSCAYSVKKTSYKIEDIVKYIKEYFGLDNIVTKGVKL